MAQALSLLVVAAAVAGCLYQVAAALLVRRFAAAPPLPAAAAPPPVSVMKPLCGAEPGMADNLASCLRQDYPAFQLVFGVADAADPALAEVARLATGTAEITTVIDATPHGRNLKVGNLLNMWPRVRHDLIDSDIRVEPHYLNDVVAPFLDPVTGAKVGVVTCLYIGTPVDGVWSALGALGVNHGFLPSALLARAIGRKDGCFGATMAVRRAVLERAGGLERLADILADDWKLGHMARQSGLGIELAARPVHIMVHEPDFATLLAHEIRWGRTIAAVDRPSYLASVITQPVALAVLAVAMAMAGGGWAGPAALAALAAAFACRLWAVRSGEKALGLPRAGLGLLAMREFLSFLVYVVASCGRTVIWRGRRFVVRRDGTLDLVEGSAP